MKGKETRLYNMLFPSWFLTIGWPALVYWWPGLLLVLGGNLALDSLVIFLAAACGKLPEKGKLWKRSILRVWLLGFVCDGAGALCTALCWSLLRAAAGGLGRFPLHLLSAAPGVILAGVLLYWASRKFSFSPTGLQGKQLHSLSLAIALCTAPYLMLLPLG